MELPDRPKPAAESPSPGATRMEVPDQGQRPLSAQQAPLISDPGTVLKIAAVGVAGVVAVAGLVWMVSAALRTDPRPQTEIATVAAAPAPAPSDLISLVALEQVRVKVVQVSDDRELFNGTLSRGETRSIQKRGQVRITYDIGANLVVERDGRRFAMTSEGLGRNSFD
jgi:hypothetical protein